ncbi:Nuclear hormone receptor [Aphelenchoides avenae]|nr:Nuclear hormone receptor [Aphelenchus avenae]
MQICRPKPRSVEFWSEGFEQLTIARRVQLEGTEDLPLGAKGILPRCTSSEVRDIIKHFVFAEKLCDTFDNNSKDPNKFNVSIPASEAFRKPGAICARGPINWQPTNLAQSSTFHRNYLRVIAHYFDWVSHIPELDKFSEQDKELLVAARAMPCSVLLMCHRSAQHSTDGVAVTGGVYFPERGGPQLEPELRGFTTVVDAAVADLVRPIQSIEVTEAEYAMLRIICFCTAVPGMSSEGLKVVSEMKEKYLHAFTQLVRLSYPNTAFDEVVGRIGRLLVLLPATEV